LRVIEGGVRS